MTPARLAGEGLSGSPPESPRRRVLVLRDSFAEARHRPGIGSQSLQARGASECSPGDALARASGLSKGEAARPPRRRPSQFGKPRDIKKLAHRIGVERSDG